MKALRFIGIDENILDYCPVQERLLYKAFNILQLLLIVIVGFSTYYLFDVIFENTYLSIALALFWSFIFYNLYRFMLITTSGMKGEKIRDKISIWIPNTFKILVVAFFAVFISLPIELYLNDDFIERNLPKALEKKIQKVKADIDQIYYTEYYEIESRINKMRDELRVLDNLINEQEQKLKQSKLKAEQRQIFLYLGKLQKERHLLHEEYLPYIRSLITELQVIDNEKRKDLQQYKSIIKNSNLLLERFDILIENRALSGFFLAAFVVLLFLSPLAYKLYSLYRMGFQYEKVNHDRNKHEILYHYHLFKERFTKITKEVFGEEKEFIERYEDAPFNTIKKSETILKEKKGKFSEDLIKEYNKKIELGIENEELQ